MRAYYVVVAGEFSYIHVVEDDSLSEDKIKEDIVVEVYGEKIETEVTILQLKKLPHGSGTFSIEIKADEPQVNVSTH